MRGSGRQDIDIEACEADLRVQEMFGIPTAGEIDYSQVVQLDLDSVRPSLAGPNVHKTVLRYRICMTALLRYLVRRIASGGFNKDASENRTNAITRAAHSSRLSIMTRLSLSVQWLAKKWR